MRCQKISNLLRSPMDLPNRAWIETLSDEEKAELAGSILDEVDPNYQNLKIFWAQLTEDVRAELSIRIQDEEL